MRLGIDIGGTKTEAVAVDDAGGLLEVVRYDTATGGEGVLGTALRAADELAARLQVDLAGFGSVGVGIPGTVDPVTGSVRHAVNLGIEHFELGDRMSTRLGRQVRVENDVKAAAMGAFVVLGSAPSDSLAYLNVGTGLAAGLVLQGRLWRGRNGWAGEVGHIPFDPAGPVCGCGQWGCAELYASGSGIARRWPTTASPDFFPAAAEGDPEARLIRDELYRVIASTIRNLVLTIDVDRIVLGGGLGVRDDLLAGVQDVLRGWSAASAFVTMLDIPGRLSVIDPQVPVAALGAAQIGSSQG